MLPPNEPISENEIPERLSEEALRAVEDLTLAQMLGAFSKQPRQTLKAFIGAIQDDESSAHMLAITSSLSTEQADASGFVHSLRQSLLGLVTQSRIFGYTVAFLIVLMGNSILAAQVGVRRAEEMQLVQGFPFIIIGFFVWLITEIFFSRNTLHQWWLNRNNHATDAYTLQTQSSDLPWYETIPLWRFGLALVAVILSTITYIFTAENTFTTPIFYIWLFSILSWSIVFAPFDFNIFDWATTLIDRWRAFRWQPHLWVIACLLVIMLGASYFRFYDLDNHPLEMTDDHVEKILDAGRVRDGARQVFFANNGGREPVQMYLIALVSHLPTFGINHDTIKFVSSIESLLTIPVLFWMGYAIFEGEPKRRRLLMGLILAALVAISYWHVVITRQGLRIPLTPLVVSLQLIYLLRGIRHNRRSDFIIAGLILGFGLYTYQAVRMLPVVIVVAVLIAILFKAKTFKQRITYVVNLSVLVAISFSVFIPLFRFSVDFPELFWRRTTGRLLGDDVIQNILADGTVVYRDATVPERFDAFLSNVPTIASNIRNVLLMFNWEGDIATISGVSNRPAMDIWSASLLILGMAAWLIFAIRKRDTVYWLIPVIA
ncbi:MAG: glycosyltransferase family 39 protein, partial [Phototrophicaceae bacterium]